MRNAKLAFMAGLTFVSMACVRTARNEATGEVDVDIESPTKRGEDWNGTLTGQGMYTSVSGTVRALYAEGRTSITLTVRNAAPGANYGWDVREGKCGTRGAVLGSADAYTPLVIGSDGTAGKTLDLNARLDEAKDYAVTIYSSPSDMSTVVACGDLDD